MSTGVELIAAERRRQVVKKGRTAEGDDVHVKREMLHCAVTVADDVLDGTDICGDDYYVSEDSWPLERAAKIVEKYGDDHVARLVIAGALIAAEIDRLLRKEKKENSLVEASLRLRSIGDNLRTSITKEEIGVLVRALDSEADFLLELHRAAKKEKKHGNDRNTR